MIDATNHVSITRSISPSLDLTILAGISIFWQKTLSQNTPVWPGSCTGFPKPMSAYFPHCTQTGDPAEQQTAPSRTDMGPSPRWQLRGHGVQFHPTQTGLGKYLLFVSPKSWPEQFVGLLGVRGIWHCHRITQVSGPLSNTTSCHV